jgi:hypothetical protein
MKVKAIFLFLAIFLLSNVSISAQQRARVKKSEFKIINTGFKDAWKAVRQGNKYFDEGPGTYRDARKEYLKAYRSK